MKSHAQKATLLLGLVDTKEITPAASKFLAKVCPLIIARAKVNQPSGLTEPQEEWFLDLYDQHFS